MSSAASKRFNPALEAPSGSTNDENVSVELPSLNQDRHGHSENESGKEPWNADLLEKRTTQVFKVLQLLGLVTGGRSRRLPKVFMLLIALMVWIPPMSLSAKRLTYNIAFLGSCSFASFRGSLWKKTS